MSLTIDVPDSQDLFHYQAWTDPKCKERLEATLRDQTIYLSIPGQFNDPWDCKPFFDLKCLEDPKIRDEHIEYFMRLGNDTDPNRAQFMRDNPLFLQKMVVDCASEMAEQIDREYRVYCLTPSDANLLMWSHYGESHKGICLQFDARAPSIARALYKVKYEAELPRAPLTADDDATAETALLTKSSAWSYEEERRLIANREGYGTRGLVVTKGGHLDISDGALTAIVVGCSCPGGQEIVDMVKHHRPHITVRKAARLPHRYGLSFTPIYLGA
jgi:hypothetical protein